jgi:DNA-binding protein H-NS
MADLKQLLAQKAALDKQIEEVKRDQREQAITQVRELMAQYGLSMADLQAKGAGKRTAAKRSSGSGKVAAKYRNPDSGETWSGRGLQPRWMKAALAAGRKQEDFRI